MIKIKRNPHLNLHSYKTGNQTIKMVKLAFHNTRFLPSKADYTKFDYLIIVIWRTQNNCLPSRIE